MTHSEHDQFSSSIRITREEAMSEHVEDLLQRQMSLRGDSQAGGMRFRKWYYQNWFVFMIAAGMAAVAGWAILEPNFNDHQYVQGTIENISLDGRNINEFVSGTLRINGEDIYIYKQLQRIQDDGNYVPLDPAELKQGQEIGVYVECEEAPIPGGGIEFVAVGVFVDIDPPADSATQLSLRQLEARTTAMGFIFFAVVGGCIGLAIGAADGLICRLPRRALLGGGIGLLVGFIGGFVSNIIANLVYAPLNQMAMEDADGLDGFTPFGFAIQILGRGFAWLLAGMTMGLGQGIALRSKRLLLYGFLGGIIGGLIGGLLFDPIDLLLLGGDKLSTHWSRLVGLGVVGLCVGAMIGVVELLARDAWLRMLEGPLAGKEFLIFKDTVNVGASPRADIYLFNDPTVADIHATIRTVGDQCEIENLSMEYPTEVNHRQIKTTRLRHGDQIGVGRTVFVYQQRHG